MFKPFHQGRRKACPYISHPLPSFTIHYFYRKTIRLKNTFSVLSIAALLLTACATQEPAADKSEAVLTDTAVAAKPGPLNATMTTYYTLKDAFVKGDATAADMNATALRLNIDSLSAQKLQADSSLTDTITNYRKEMLGSIDSLVKGREMEGKRRQFSVLSDHLYHLAKALPYQGETIYQVHCPMAFKTGANWLNNQPLVNNPYYGSAMLTCGEVVDSVMQQ
jgi:hypothetical protein